MVCDSQAVLKVSADIPKEVPFTTFSILFARQKGDIIAAAEGAASIEQLQPGDKVLIAEACTHHALEDDIGRVKIPRWLRQYVGGEIRTDVSAGRDYPDNLGEYKLIIHCGACMLNRREMLNRIQRAREAGVSVTNYGVAISFLQGLARRTLSPFPAALMAMDKILGRKNRGGEGKMTAQSDLRVGVVSIIVTRREQQAAKVNSILTEHGGLIIGRMGLPYPPKKISIISLIVHGTTDEIGAMTGKLGLIEGVQVKSALTKA